MKDLEITKMITVSTVHLRKETCDDLDNDNVPITYYKKGEYGYFIHIWVDELGNVIESLKMQHEDLAKLICFAYSLGCEWLCIDCDGPEVDGLDKYGW